MTDLTQGALAPVTTPSVYIFQNGKPHAVRVRLDAQGEPLFHVGDLCDLLEHTNSRQALRDNVETDDVRKADVIDRLGRTQSANFVTEPGMWSLVIGSRAPNAKKVKRWLTSEVLPAIRKTGRYQAAAAPVPDYERCTNRQQQALATAMSRAFGLSIFGQEGTQHGFNRLRLEHRLHNIADLPAADFERAMATVGELATMNMAFAVWFGEIRKLYLAEYVEAGGPWTLWLKREWKKQMGTALPPRPDWLEVQKKLGLYAG